MKNRGFYPNCYCIPFYCRHKHSNFDSEFHKKIIDDGNIDQEYDYQYSFLYAKDYESLPRYFFERVYVKSTLKNYFSDGKFTCKISFFQKEGNSNSFTSENEGYCCYSNGKCYFYSEKPEEMNGLECPKENGKLKNTCGLAGRFPPINEGQCNGITLVEAFCCYVEVKGETACLRSKTKPKKKETTTEDIKKALSAYYNNNVPENYLVKCEAKKMKGILGKEMIFGFVLFIGSLIF